MDSIPGSGLKDPALLQLLFNGCCLDSVPGLGSSIKKKKSGVPVMAQRLVNLTGIHEDTVSIPGLTQWAKDPALP